MIKNERNEYNPDYVSPPGNTLVDLLKHFNITQVELARRMGRHLKTVNEMIKGKAPITPETALQLEKVLRAPASFWNNRERRYREYLAEQKEKQDIKKHIEWLKNIPVNEMVKLGWIKKCPDKEETLVEVFKFFGTVGPEQIDGLWGNKSFAFRQSKAFENNNRATYAWLKKGEIEAQKILCEEFNKKKFTRSLYKIKALTNEPPGIFVPEIQSLCAASGAAVVFIPGIKGIRASGVTQWLAPNKALIQLSLRYKRNDHLWFTFFHEAAHILLHSKKMMFIEGMDGDDRLEEEADRYAENFLVPKKNYPGFVKKRSFGKAEILAFAKELGIAPGIVVGRLQHDNHIEFSHHHDLFVKLDWSIIG
jgi:addiction module HigA family antidote